jgi:hypothetical protein
MIRSMETYTWGVKFGGSYTLSGHQLLTIESPRKTLPPKKQEEKTSADLRDKWGLVLEIPHGKGSPRDEE